MRKVIFLLLVLPGLALAGAGPAPVANQVWLLPGQAGPGRQPDGNSILLEAPQGFIIVDTGRHPNHTDQLLKFVDARDAEISAVINTHWHLDHLSGNFRVRETFPDVVVYASPALNGALDSFLAEYRRYIEQALPGLPADSAQRDELQSELATLQRADALAPDKLIEATGTRRIAGRELEVHLVDHAVTGGDVWLLDPATRTLIAGDLVTLPVPFLDTACPTRWQAALADLDTRKFERLIPGHGRPMTATELHRYRAGFDALLDCAAGDAGERQCVDGWLRDMEGLVDASEYDYARDLLTYYLGQVLRKTERDNPNCRGE